MDIIKWLKKEGYTPMEIEEILRSKLMRWAGDNANKGENVTLLDFKRFNTKYKGKSQVEIFLDKEIRPNKEEYLKQTGFNESVNEDAMGGVSSPMSTLNNTPGMGNAQPAQMAAMTGSQQQSPLAKGSGDKWGNTIKNKPYTQAKSIITKKKKKKKLEEENINPYDKLGVAMAKKMKVPITFKKHKKDQGVSQKRVGESIMTLDKFIELGGI